jgi:hypothetical protein
MGRSRRMAPSGDGRARRPRHRCDCRLAGLRRPGAPRPTRANTLDGGRSPGLAEGGRSAVAAAFRPSRLDEGGQWLSAAMLRLQLRGQPRILVAQRRIPAPALAADLLTGPR